MEALVGKNLIDTVVSATGLPEDPIQRELNSLLAQFGKDPEHVTLEDLREIMADYLQTVLLEAKEELSAECAS